MARGRWMLLLMLVAGAAGAQPPGRGDAATARGTGGGPTPMLPWVDLATSRPVVMRFQHDIQYDPNVPRVVVRRSQWRVERLEARVFGGRAGVQGYGEIEAGRPSDVATTLTLQAMDVQQALRFLALPRADEMEAALSGTLYVRVTGGEWADVSVRLWAEPGTVRLSRGLIKELLGGALDAVAIEERVEPTLSYHFGDAAMIPVRSMRIEGDLEGAELRLNIPISNEAIDLDFEPRIERPLLWDVWNYLKNAGLRDLEAVEWEVE